MPLHVEPSDRYTRFAIHLSRARPGLHSFITTLTPHGPQVDRILRQVSLSLWEQYETYESGTNFLDWAVAIARQHMLRDHAPDSATFTAALIQRLAEDTLADGELQKLAAERRAVGQAIAKLPPGDRNLIRELYSGRQTARAIAARMNRPPEHIHHRMNHLRRTLTPRDDQTPAPQPLSTLIEALCNNTLDAAGLAELEAMLLNDPEARRAYRHAMNIHATLRQYAKAAAPTSPKIALKPVHVIIAAAVIVLLVTLAAIIAHRIFPAPPARQDVQKGIRTYIDR